MKKLIASVLVFCAAVLFAASCTSGKGDSTPLREEAYPETVDSSALGLKESRFYNDGSVTRTFCMNVSKIATATGMDGKPKIHMVEDAHGNKLEFQSSPGLENYFSVDSGKLTCGLHVFEVKQSTFAGNWGAVTSIIK